MPVFSLVTAVEILDVVYTLLIRKKFKRAIILL